MAAKPQKADGEHAEQAEQQESSVPNLPYLVKEDGKTPRKDEEGNIIPNLDYVATPDGSSQEFSIELKQLVNLSWRVVVLAPVDLQHVVHPFTKEESQVLMLREGAKPIKVPPGGMVVYPEWVTRNPRLGLVKATKPKAGSDFGGWWTEDQIIEFWKYHLSPEVFKEVTRDYQARLNDHRPKVTAYIAEMNAKIDKVRQQRMLQPTFG